ncbi:MAG: aspartate kinase, partial [Gammaproteobacteria bacterium]|nr:aspartate kinase [Gammaproteobacteria bacterium]
MNAEPWVIHKFGGSSLADAAHFRRVAEILAVRNIGPQAIVVSAVAGVTDRLLDLVEMARQRDDGYTGQLAALRADHERLADALLGRGGAARDAFQERFDPICQNIADVLHATLLIGSDTATVRDVVAGAGELWSAQLLAGLLQMDGEAGTVDWLDARDVLVIEHSELGPGVLWDESRSALRARIASDFSGLLVITGFIARDRAGVQTTLGRNGSDYSASIFGALLDASQVNIWTDVPGVMSADPRLVTESSVIPELTYDEAMELAYFGAKVLHPQTMAPAVDGGIPIYIRDSAMPNTAGTRIGSKAVSDDTVKGITAIDGMSLVNVEGAGMIGVPGTAWRLFGALREAGVSVVLISQGSSEHSICFAVRDEHAKQVDRILAQAFHAELDSGQIHSVDVTPNCSILAVVGDGMAGIPGVAAKVFGSLGRAGINVRAIAQGSSERNISAVIDQTDTVRALRAVHAGFYLSPQTLSIGLIGPGSVGGVLLEQLSGEASRLAEDLNLDLRIRALATSKHMVLDDRKIGLGDWRDRMGAAGEPLDIDRFVRHVQVDHIPHSVIIDCTASQDVAERYAEWLARGIHIVTPNKKANSGSFDYYQRLIRERRSGDARYLYETTVGAALPIIQTLRDLRETGDRI